MTGLGLGVLSTFNPLHIPLPSRVGGLKLYISYLGRNNDNNCSYFYYWFPAKICLVCLLPSLNSAPSVPIAHCSDATVEVKILICALGSGEAEHRPRLAGYCSIPEIFTVMFWYLSDQPRS